MDGKPLRLASGTKGSPANSFDGLIFWGTVGCMVDIWRFPETGVPQIIHL